MEPKTWGEMTPEEKGALLLAEHEGKVIECLSTFDGQWSRARKLSGDAGVEDHWIIRIKPEPKRAYFTMKGAMHDDDWHRGTFPGKTHRITFDLIDGEPDCDSIKMERLS